MEHFYFVVEHISHGQSPTLSGSFYALKAGFTLLCRGILAVWRYFCKPK